MPESHGIDDIQPHKLVQIGEYLRPAEAAMLAAVLEERGIDSKVIGGELTTMLSWYGTAVGGARVLVAQAHAAEAASILAEAQTRFGDIQPDTFPDDFDFGDETPEEFEDQPEELSETLMRRAFIGAIVGLMLAPLFVWGFSIWLIFRHSLWKRSEDWRLYMTLVCIFFGFLVTKWTYGF